MAIDTPITSRAEDQLGRASFANTIAAAIRSLDASQGAVVGLFGPWGVGKTSLLNMIRETLKDEPALVTVEFNPWMFSGAEQLVTRFFEEVSKQLRRDPGRFVGVADQLLAYGEAVAPLQFIPVAGPWIARTAAVAKAASKLRREAASVHAQRARLVEVLAELKAPLVVTIDDIDRLRPSEIRDIFQLVRLTGNFPQVIYLLAFDRARVEDVLDDEGVGGRAYLEKIVEIPYGIPRVPDATLNRLLLEGLDEAIQGVEAGPFDEQRWPDVFYRGMRPLFTNLRDVKRYLATVPAMLATLGDEVALVDALALEAMRLFTPDAHAQLWVTSAALTQSRGGSSDAEQGQQIEALIQAGDEHTASLRELVPLLFPAKQGYGPEWHGRWRRERRVASPDVLAFYLNRILGPGVAPSRLVDLIFEALPDEETLRSLFSDLDEDMLEDVLGRLETYEEDFPPEAAESGAAVLLELYPRLRTQSRGMFDTDADIIVGRVVLRLLRRVTDQEELTAIVERLSARVPTLHAQLELIELVGHRPNVGTKLIPAADADRIDREVCERIRHADAAQLATERGVLTLLVTALTSDPDDRAFVDAQLEDPQLFAAVLRDAIVEVRSQSVGHLAVRKDEQLSWDSLTLVFGGEDKLRNGLSSLEQHLDDADEDPTKRATDLARRYLTGWRPGRQRPSVTTRTPMYGPDGPLSPSGSHGWPDLTLRAVSVFDLGSVAPEDVAIEPDFRRAFEGTLRDGPLGGILQELADHLGIDAGTPSWTPDVDAFQSTATAVMTLSAATEVVGQPPPVQLRCGVLLPDMHSRGVRVIVDVYIRRPPAATSDDEGAASSRESTFLPLTQVAHLLATCLRAAAEGLPAVCLPALVGTSALLRSAVEVYLMAARSGPPGQPMPRTLTDMIDLTPLGAGPRQVPTEGRFAANGGLSLRGEYDPGDVVATALRKMALDWGYLDPDPGLPP